MDATRNMVPKTLDYAAKAYAENPNKLGEIVLALVNGSDAKLDEGQRVVLAMCRDELAEKERQRELARDRKRRFDAKKKGRCA